MQASEAPCPLRTDTPAGQGSSAGLACHSRLADVTLRQLTIKLNRVVLARVMSNSGNAKRVFVFQQKTTRQ